MSDDVFPAEDERDLRAAELALGLLDGSEEADARRLADTDAGFAQQVARWRARFAPLFEDVEAVEPRAEVYTRIERALRLRQGDAAGASNDNELRRKLARWRFSAASLGAVAAALALVLWVRPPVAPAPSPEVIAAEQAAPAGPMMVAAIAGEDKVVRMVATYDPASRHLVIADAAPVETPSGRSHELWMIPADGKPVSMGVMPTGKPMVATIDPDKAAAFINGLTLAVSDEPAGGSPTGQPTGAVLASGALTNA
jgi:anti-sigma-K factor RskA